VRRALFSDGLMSGVIQRKQVQLMLAEMTAQVDREAMRSWMPRGRTTPSVSKLATARHSLESPDSRLNIYDG